MAKEIDLSVVIPCYCAAGNIINVLREIDHALKDRQLNYEVILVNDASPDDTYAVISSIALERQNVVAVDLAKNSGQHAAIMAGFHYARGNMVATFEDDGQSDAGLLPAMADKLNEGFDVVMPRYTQRAQPSPARRLGSKCAKIMEDWMIEKPEGIYVSIYFMARRFVINEVIKYDQPYPYIAGLLLRSTYNICNIEAVQKERLSGASGYNFKKLFSLWLNGFTAFSIKPLRVSIILGAVSAGAGIISGIIVVCRKLMGYGVALGWSSMMAVMLFMFGILLAVMGMAGEYIGRIYMCVNKTPQFLVREVAGLEKGVGDRISESVVDKQ